MLVATTKQDCRGSSSPRARPLIAVGRRLLTPTPATSALPLPRFATSNALPSVEAPARPLASAAVSTSKERLTEGDP